MEAKVLSSKLTFISKFVFPVLWITLFGSGAVEMWAGTFTGKDNTPPPPELKYVFLGAWIVGTAFILWTSAGLKEVSVDGQSIRVSNYLEEINIPADMIADITENRWIKGHPITIHLRSDTAFGQKIKFLPKSQLLGAWSTHPAVAELRRLAGPSIPAS
jgi:hypothetical protein